MPSEPDREYRYRLPFEWVKAALGDTVTVTMSAKLSAAHLERNRYAVLSPQLDRIDIPALCHALQLPAEAAATVETLRAQHQLAFVGAGEQGPVLSYRLYFGFARPETPVCFAVEWIPSHTEFMVRKYQRVNLRSQVQARQLICENLASDMEDQNAILDVVTRLLERSPPDDAYVVREDGNSRRSVDFGLAEGSLTFSDAADVLGALAQIFALPKGDYSAWHESVAHQGIGRIAVGWDRHSLPFVTLYGGIHDEPVYCAPGPRPALPDMPVFGKRQASLNSGVTATTKQPPSRPMPPKERSAAPSPTKVYVLGTIGYEFISDSRHDSLAQAMAVPDAGRADAFLRHVEDNPHVAESVVWTVRMDSTPIYALYPTGAYARSTYERLVELLRAQEAGAVHRVSIPGIAPGATARTRSGQTLPVLFPELRGMYGWTTESLVASVCGPRPADEAGQEQYAAKAQRVLQFLERVYYELRNLGVTPQERALNFAATNAYQVEQVYAHALGESMELHKIDVVKSPVARPGADSWDVKLTFFHPERRLERASVEYRFTVDVSDVMPLTTGPVRKWSVF